MTVVCLSLSLSLSLYLSLSFLVWIDPQSRLLLRDEQKTAAKRALKSIYLRWETTASSTPTSAPAEPVPSNAADPNDFQAYFESVATSGVPQPAASNSHGRFQTCLKDIEQLGRVKGANVWEVIDLFPKLIQPVARIVCALPSTQVSVERIFSHLKLILRENWLNMAEDLAEEIIFLRTNKCV